MSRKEPQVLEAITAMARIATLTFYPNGAKIAFRNHKIVICSTDVNSLDSITYSIVPKSLLQGFDRYWNSDSRDDLYIFNHVIKNFVDLYLTPCKQTDKDTYSNLINLVKYTCLGLIKLQKTYEDQYCNAVLVIQLYINILKDLIQEKYDPSTFYDIDTEHTIFDMDKFKTFWSKDDLNTMCNQFNGCFKSQAKINDVIFKQESTQLIDLILDSNELILPEPNNQSQPIVRGFIVSIIEILNSMDDRFIDSLTQSLQGR